MTVRVPRLPFSLDPLIAEAKRRARRRRWLTLLVVVVVAVAAASVELRSASGPGLAAGGKPVVHIVIEYPPTTAYVNLKTGRRTAATAGEQMWVDRRTGRHRIVSTEGGRRVADAAWTPHYGPATEAAAVDRFYAALATGFRAALKDGTVKLVARGSFDGHLVDWLKVTPRRDQRWYVLRELGEVGIDAHTYKPILLRGLSGKRYVYTRILRAQSIAFSANEFKSHGPKQIPATTVRLAPGYAFGTPGPVRRDGIVPAPWLTAGRTVAGLELRSVSPFTIRKTKHRFYYGAPRPKAIHGLALVYAPAANGSAPTVPSPVNVYGRPRDARAATRLTVVYEVPQGNTAPWKLVPAHSVEVQSGFTTVGNRVVRSPWIGYLKKQGLYITIGTPEGPRTALQIARSLHG